LTRFGLVGGSGVLVNLLATIIAKKVGGDEQAIFWNLPLTDFNVRWYHVFSTIGFVFANVWNFQLNRLWTFKSSKHAGWFREYFPFLAVGLLGQLIGLLILTALMHPGSIVSLSPTFFDNSTGFRTRFFVLNKLWTFSAVRGNTKVALAETGPEPPEEMPEEHVDRSQDTTAGSV
jgi:putative flippase GtrA